MEAITSIYDIAKSFIPSALMLVVIVLVFILVRKIFERRFADMRGYRFRLQLTMVFLGFGSILVILLVLPINDTTRGQLLSLIGILLSAAIALSSTTILGNAMAGFMLRVIKGFRIGDFIRSGDHFGRVTERSIFHIEIQNENRDLTTLPNLFLVTHPVRVVRTSGTYISATVSLGYDVNRHQVKKLLLQAAEKAELEEPYVHITQLGDFSITYKVAGLLSDVKSLISAQPHLHSCMLDTLHEGGIEIVSPNFMNTRAVDPEIKFMPIPERVKTEEKEAAPDTKIFDKAEEAESIEKLREKVTALNEEISANKKLIETTGSPEEKSEIEIKLKSLEERKERLSGYIKRKEEPGK